MNDVDHVFCDLTEEEESRLPLPDGWISMIKIPLTTSSAGPTQLRTYKNVRLTIESNEHPLIVQAQAKAKKRGLPEGWQLKSMVTRGGETEIFYYNSQLEFSMWDHPLLRSELCDILSKAGQNPGKLGIAREPVKPSASFLQTSEAALAQPAAIPLQASNYSVMSEKVSVVSAQGPSNRSVGGEASTQYAKAKSDRSVAISELDRSMDSVASSSEGPSDDNDNGPLHPTDATSVHHTIPAGSVSERSVEQLYLEMDSANGASAEQGGDMPSTAEYEFYSGNPAFSPGADTDLLQHDEYQSVQSESVVDNQRDWESVLNAYKDPGTEFDRISHRVKHIKPPVTVSGIRVLREDVMEANERVHQLLMRLRSMLSAKSGIESSILYPQNSPVDGNSQRQTAPNNVTLASDIVTALRQKPEFIVLAMANTNNVRDGSSVMVQTAFTVLHRLLHPFSADNSMTTAVLLQGINYQLDELTAVEQVFSELDSKVIIARALFVSDPNTAVTWDPLLSPLPVVPETRSETVLTCLLRVYAIRRDVTSYFRTVWRPILPGVVALLKQHGEAHRDEQQHHNSKAHSFANIIAVANRLLECTLSEKSILTFPPIATAVCRAVHEIGGQLAMHTYLFQLLILPNLLKVLAGDHESSENEDIYRVDNVEEIVNKYYDCGFWFKKEGEVESPEPGAGPGILDPLRTLIWLVWRIYTCSVFMSDTAVTALGMTEFLSDSKPIELDQHAYAYPPMRLRNTLRRLRRKIDRGCAFLLSMPMDAQGSEYLGVSEEEEELALAMQIQKLEAPTEMAQLLDRRVHALHFKPNEMLNLTIASRYEVGALFSDIALAMEMHDQAAKNPIYNAIAEYLNHNMDFDAGAAHEELMELSFLYVSDDFSGYGDNVGVSEEKAGGSFDTNELVTSRYDQLLRGLRLCNRYEDSLIKMVTRLQSGRVSSLFELAEDESWFHAPEFDANAKSDTVRLSKVHTAGSISKKKNAHYGLARSANVPVFPLFSRHNPQDHHPNVKSWKALQQDVIKSYRFHTSAPSANAGTSIARPKVLPPKVHPSSVIVTTTEAGLTTATRSRSRYTKIEINAKSNILVPTKSVVNQRNQMEENPTQKHSKFLKSLRDHSVIPTDEFQARYQRIIQERRRHKRQLLEQQLNRDESVSDARVGAGHNARNLKPFPEHLRHRQHGQLAGLYHDNGGDPRSSYESGHSHGRSRSTERSRNATRGVHRSGRYDHDQHYDVHDAAVESPHSLAQDIIREYSNLFVDPSQGQGGADRPHFMYVSRATHHRSVSPSSPRHRSRSLSPGLPEPMPAQTRFQSPTRALLHRLTDSSEHELRKSLELRKHDRNTDFEAEEPFSPTANKFYPPRGLRVPRVPEFLYNDEISDYSRSPSPSRTTSRSLSRSNSFSSSPVRGRSRDNSFSDLRHICRRGPEGEAPEYEEEEYLPISEPVKPVQVPIPNTVSIDLTAAREAVREPASSDDHSWTTGSSLPKHKKVNVSVVPVGSPMKIATDNAPTQQAAPVYANPDALRGAPRVITLSAATKWKGLQSHAPAPPVDTAAVPKRPEPVRPAEAASSPVPVVLKSTTAPPLSPPPVVREHRDQGHAPAPAAATEHRPIPLHTAAPASATEHRSIPLHTAPTVKPAVHPEPVGPPVSHQPLRISSSHAHSLSPPTDLPVSQPAPRPLPVPPSVPAPVVVAPTPKRAEDSEPVAFQYAMAFPSRSEHQAVGGELPSHVYDVNAAYAEAYERTKARMHVGLGAEEDGGEDSQGELDEDDLRLLMNAPASRRESMRAALMQKQKSKSRRASKLFADDDQIVSFLINGFQAIKVGSTLGTGEVNAVLAVFTL
jgi:hypothetical protein